MDKLSYNELDIVDLVKYLASSKGVSTKKDEKQKLLEEVIDIKKKVLFILVDGLGYSKVKSLYNSSILKNHCRLKINTVIPTSTACVLTSIFTGTYPSSHGIFGWWARSKKLDMNYYPLLAIDSDTNKSFADRNIKDLPELYSKDSIFDTFSIKPSILMNKNIINSMYSKAFSGKRANRYGYTTIKDAFNIANEKIDENKETFTYLYIDKLDVISHQFGVDSEKALSVIEEIEDGIKSILSKERKDLTVIVTADHGQVESKEIIYLNETYNFSKYFYANPVIDTRIITFFVKEECKEEFEEKIKEKLGEDIELLDIDKVEKLRLFGNSKFSKEAKDTLGEYIGIFKTNKFLICDEISYNDYIDIKGNHSGITKEETEIPLIVI